MRNRPLTPEERWQIGATMLGITLAEYRDCIQAGEKWCSACKAWHPRSLFATRSTRPDGLDNACREVVNARARRNMARLRADRRAS